MYSKCWESMRNFEKFWNSVPIIKKVCQMLRKNVKVCQKLKKYAKYLESMPKRKYEKVWEILRKCTKNWERVIILFICIKKCTQYTFFECAVMYWREVQIFLACTTKMFWHQFGRKLAFSKKIFVPFFCGESGCRSLS